MQCSFDGCSRTAKAMGLCPGHRRQQKAGETLRPLQIQYHGLTEFDRFMKRIEVGHPNDCWNWTGSAQKVGWHGQWRNAAGQIEPTHRAAWRLMKGEIPPGVFVLHRCDNPICCNPLHLFLGSQSDNLLDMWAKGRARPKTHRGESHGMAKLTAEKVREIRTSNEQGTVLAKRLGVSPTTVCDVRKRRIWDHIP